MSRIIYVNGCYENVLNANISALDRGFHFGDGVYEVTALYKGYLVDNKAHIDRLFSSLEKIRIAHNFYPGAIETIMKTVALKNKILDGTVYIGISRGAAPRDHLFPENTSPTIICLSKRLKYPYETHGQKGIDVITRPEVRWKRCDIKSLNLLGNVLAKQEAKDFNVYETWFYNEQEEITEASLSNAWIINSKGELQTHPADNQILNGITRQHIIRIAQENNLTVKEIPFSKKDAYNAKEAFVSGTTGLVLPVSKIDGFAIGSGEPGEISKKLRKIYIDFMASYINKKGS